MKHTVHEHTAAFGRHTEAVKSIRAHNRHRAWSQDQLQNYGGSAADWNTRPAEIERPRRYNVEKYLTKVADGAGYDPSLPGDAVSQQIDRDAKIGKRFLLQRSAAVLAAAVLAAGLYFASESEASEAPVPPTGTAQQAHETFNHGPVQATNQLPEGMVVIIRSPN